MNARTAPKDFFVQLGATIALYVAAGALINLLFSIVNAVNPDALAGYFSPSSIVWPVSMLIVLTPILYGLEWLVNRDAAQMPEKKDIWIRRWRIYLTIFLSVVLVGGDLIALINVYLNGEVTGRFIWKVLAILVVAGVIGKYYFFSISEKWKWARMIRRGNAWFGIILVVAAIVGGFLIVGSPAKQRAIRFDEQRISDLMSIQYQIINYWQSKATLPAKLADLNDPISNFTVPVDPETGSAYQYSVKGITDVKNQPGSPSGLVFELCATFDLDSSALPQNYAGSPVYNSPMIPAGTGTSVATDWSHAAGRACFDRTIDSQRYPPYPKPLSP